MGVEFTGDWDGAIQVLQNFQKNLDRAVKRGLNKAGAYLVGQIKKGIRAGKPGGKQYAPNHPYTIAQKGSSKPMIDDGDFINAVTMKLDGGTLFVGVLKTAKDPKTGEPLINIAAVHEYGTEIEVTPKMRGYLHGTGLHLKSDTVVVKIPARPTFGPAWEKEMDEVVKIIEGEIQKVLLGG